MFSFSEGTLRVKDSDLSFHVGPFDVISLETLRARLASEGNVGKTSGHASPMTFHSIKATSADLHLDPENAGAVFQVASLFNCLEFDSPSSTPEEGVTSQGSQPTQGSACASACPAAAVFRTYFVNGTGQADAKQVDCLSEVSDYLDNGRNRFWSLKNGFCMPTKDFMKVNKRLEELNVDTDIRNKFQVGIHWDTEVAGGSHRVTQVFCSAAPVGLSKIVRADEWEAVARIFLEAQFEATLTAAACLAKERGERVQVYLTPVGGGVLGNRVKWIADALERALTLHQAAPLDVHLVHLTFPFMTAYQNLEKAKWKPPRREKRTVTQDVRRLSVELKDIHDEEEIEDQDDMQTEHARRIAKTFAFFDLNGDGVIDRREFMEILLMLDAYFFTVETVDKMLAMADADGDGEVHYVEFASWLAGAECDAVVRNLFTAALAKTGESDFKNDLGKKQDDLYVEPSANQTRRASNLLEPSKGAGERGRRTSRDLSESQSSQVRRPSRSLENPVRRTSRPEL